MEEWSKVPVFGERAGFSPSVIRDSAYVLAIGEDGRLAVVRTSQGTFLPGGGIETGETPWQAGEREVMEECGLAVQPGAWVVSAIQFVYSEPEKTRYEKRSVFFDGVATSFNLKSCEPNHELVWIQAEEATRILTTDSQRWAVKEWLKRQMTLSDKQPA